MPRNDYSDLNTVIQSLIKPLVEQIKDLDRKVDDLNQNYVTRSDLEKLILSLVPKDLYEARHNALIIQDGKLEAEIKELRTDINVDLQKVHERLESGKQQIEDRFKQQSESQLSDKDRTWLRSSQAFGIVAIIIALLEFVVQHVKFN